MTHQISSNNTKKSIDFNRQQSQNVKRYSSNEIDFYESNNILTFEKTNEINAIHNADSEQDKEEYQIDINTPQFQKFFNNQMQKSPNLNTTSIPNCGSKVTFAEDQSKIQKQIERVGSGVSFNNTNQINLFAPRSSDDKNSIFLMTGNSDVQKTKQIYFEEEEQNEIEVEVDDNGFTNLKKQSSEFFIENKTMKKMRSDFSQDGGQIYFSDELERSEDFDLECKAENLDYGIYLSPHEEEQEGKYHKKNLSNFSGKI